MGVTQNYPKPEDFEPVATWPEGHAWHGQPNRCQAWNPKHGRQCLGRATKGKRVCKDDGGKSRGGIASASFKHGKYSRYMPKALAPVFEAVMKDPDLLALNTDIASHEARIDQLFQSIEGGNPGKLWAEALKEWMGLWEATAREDAKDIMKHRNRLDSLLREGSGDVETWGLILETSEQKRKLIDTETKRREKMREYVRAEEAAYYYRALALAVKANIDDTSTLSAIADEFAKIVGMAGYLSRAEAVGLQD